MEEEKQTNLTLFHRQKDLLDTFLANGAISQQQYNKSLGDLIRLMGMEDEIEF